MHTLHQNATTTTFHRFPNDISQEEKIYLMAEKIGINGQRQLRLIPEEKNSY